MASIIASILTVVSTVAQWVMQLPVGQAILGVLVLAIIGALVMSCFYGSPFGVDLKKSQPYLIFSVGLLLAIILAVTGITLGRQSGPLSPSDLKMYAVSVFVYKDSLGRGRQDATADTRQPDVEVVVHDAYYQELSDMTNKQGKAVIKMPTPGDISVDVCGISQTHHLSDKHDIINPYKIKVGVQSHLLERCREKR